MDQAELKATHSGEYISIYSKLDWMDISHTT
ncbi:hypothetical protein [Sodalis-like endosymbiont of Proechinophthirus fluctus]